MSPMGAGISFSISSTFSDFEDRRGELLVLCLLMDGDNCIGPSLLLLSFTSIFRNCFQLDIILLLINPLILWYHYANYINTKILFKQVYCFNIYIKQVINLFKYVVGKTILI